MAMGDRVSVQAALEMRASAFMKAFPNIPYTFEHALEIAQNAYDNGIPQCLTCKDFHFSNDECSS